MIAPTSWIYGQAAQDLSQVEPKQANENAEMPVDRQPLPAWQTGLVVGLLAWPVLWLMLAVVEAVAR